METLRATQARLQKAVAGGNCKRVAQVLEEHRRRLEEVLAGLPAGGRETEELERETRALLAWARQLALVSRAAAATRLRRLSRPVRAYRPAAAASRHTWEFTA